MSLEDVKNVKKKKFLLGPIPQQIETKFIHQAKYGKYIS
jgi:hypothetical protein